MSQGKPVRVRFAPSPTGHVHLGSARTALYDYLLARQTNGQFILRIEDTDRKRLVEGAEQELLNGLHELGLQWDEGPDIGGQYGPYRQSERKHIYAEYAQKLIDLGYAYPCFCTPERLARVRQERQKSNLSHHYDGLCRNLPKGEIDARIKSEEPYVIRFKSPKTGQTTVTDSIRGEIVFDNSNLDDYILVKSDGWALYHLAAIVDDSLMSITHVIRGSEWLPTFPLHSLVWRAFGWDEPIWVHLSVFLKPSGKGKMSKREATQLSQDGYSIFIKDLLDFGYLPEALINWIALMGWSYDDRTEFFTMQDLIEKFSLKKLNPSPASINFSKLDHFNKLHIKNLMDEELSQRIIPFFHKAGIDPDKNKILAIIPAIKDRMITLEDGVEFCAFLFKNKLDLDYESLIIENYSVQDTQVITKEIIRILDEIENWDFENLERVVRSYMEEQELAPKQLFGFLREAISGQKVTPPLFECMVALGKVETLNRIKKALEVLES